MKKLIHWLHLWLGILSGPVIFIIGLTGCVYVFISEIETFTEPYQYVKQENKADLLPSKLKDIAEKRFPGKKVRYYSYQPGKAVYIGMFDTDYSLALYANPYTGQVLKTKNFLDNSDFFAFILHGHRALWLPYSVGRPIVDTAVLICIFLLISGIVLWWPKNLKKANRDKSFRIKWQATFKRINYDLHNVLGFYALLILFSIAITGSVWGFQWFAKAIYFTTSGGKILPILSPPSSDTLTCRKDVDKNIDLLYQQLKAKAPQALILLFPPQNPAAAIQATINYQPGTNHDLALLYFDQYSLKPLPSTGTFKKRFRDAEFPDQVSRLNYDIHTGQILGLPGKILAFSASLICASLPVTGFFIWYNRKKGKKKNGCNKPGMGQSTI